MYSEQFSNKDKRIGKFCNTLKEMEVVVATYKKKRHKRPKKMIANLLFILKSLTAARQIWEKIEVVSLGKQSGQKLFNGVNQVMFSHAKS